MTNVKAIYYLEQLKNSYTPLLTEEEVAIDTAISALEKQDGKKPIAVNAKSTWVKCPVCGSTVIDEYCVKCGQKILWEE